MLCLPQFVELSLQHFKKTVFMNKIQTTKTEQILLVCAEKIERYFLVRLLEKEGYELTVAKDSLDAIYQLKTFQNTSRPFGLIIFDLKIADMNSARFVEKLRKLNIGTPIIMLSSTELPKKEELNYELQQVFWIEKSQLQDGLLRLIRENLG
jgi:CheY-like chemotaxis protein